MGIQELEIIDIGSEDQEIRRTKRRGEYRQEKERTAEVWPMAEWEEEYSALEEDEWETEEGDGEEDWEEDEWYDEDWEDGEEIEWEVEEEQKLRKGKHQPKKRQTVKKQDAQEEKRRRKRRKRRVRMIRGAVTAFTFMMMIGLLLVAAWLAVSVYKGLKEGKEVQPVATMDIKEMPNQDIRKWGRFYAMELERPELAVDLLTVNEYSRPGEELPEVKSIFIHYTANAGTTAEQNRSYFESLSESHERSASAHFVIGYDGTIVQCIPTKEIAYAVKGRNYDSISIECCYLKENGAFEEETYRSLIELTAWLLHKYELRPENVLRHYDEGGKNCPKYYVEHEEAWNKFLIDLASYMTEVSEE